MDTRVKPLVQKNYSDPGSETPFKPGESVEFHNAISVITKPNKNNKIRQKQYFCKLINNGDASSELLAQLETIAQEFFRLILPWQPKTRWWKRNGLAYVLSESVDGFSDFFEVDELSDELFKKIHHARVDMASILIIALFLGEKDLKNHRNLAFNKEGRILKIDGEQCLGAAGYVDYDVDPEIMAKILKNLHTLELVDRDFKQTISSTSVTFQQAMFNTIIKIALLPTYFFEVFVKCYTNDPVTIELATDHMIHHQKILVEAALNLPEFCQYTRVTENEVDNYFQHLIQFITMGKYTIANHFADEKIYLSEFKTKMRNELLALYEKNFLKCIEQKNYAAARKILKTQPQIDIKARDLVRCNKEQLTEVILMLCRAKKYNLLDFVLEKFPESNVNFYHIFFCTTEDQKPDFVVIRRLCESKAGDSLIGKQDATALSLAAYRQHDEIAAYYLNTEKILRQFNANQLTRALRYFIEAHRLELILLFFKNQKKVTVNTTIDDAKNTPILFALSQKQPDAKLILALSELEGANLALENKQNDTVLSLAAAKQRTEIILFILNNDSLISQFKPDQLGKVIFILMMNKNYELAKLFFQKQLHIDTQQYVQPETMNRAIHLAVLEAKPDNELIEGFCSTTTNLGQKNMQGQTELTIAINAGHHAIVYLLLQKGAEKYSWDEIKLAIQCLINNKINISGAMTFISAIQKTLPQSSIIARDVATKVTKQLITQATSSYEIVAMIKQLFAAEKLMPFLAIQNNNRVFPLNKWQGMDVSHRWMSLMIFAKQKIIALNEYSNEEVQNFLKTPTNGWMEFSIAQQAKYENSTPHPRTCSVLF